MATTHYILSPPAALNLLFQGILPDNTVIPASLRIVPEAPVRALPQGLSIKGLFDASGNTALTRVRNNVAIHGDAIFHSCTSLMTIGINLRANGDCDLSRCRQLVVLGENPFVEGNLILAGCSKTLILPNVGYVGGDLILPVGYDRSLISASFIVKGSSYSGNPSPREVPATDLIFGI